MNLLKKETKHLPKHRKNGKPEFNLEFICFEELEEQVVITANYE